ncbi:hypothetical protein N7334_15315 [Leclercia adecarboxylata]|nr:hypothetical protein [Leclercia adecarboxylata]MDH0063192.1 hypothetical protein [Leclercia adecarboxylata]
MRLTTKELVAEAHRAARSLPPESAKLVTELATRLDVTRAALCESLSERDRLAADARRNGGEVVSIRHHGVVL